MTITSAAPPASGTISVPYGPFNLTASGGSGSFQWSVSGVPGLTVDSASGVLSGTPTTAGADTLTVTLADANNVSSTISQNYPVAIAYPPLVITSAAPPANGTVGQTYGPFTLMGSGGSGSFLWSVSGVAGLTVNSGTGVLGGAPTASGNQTLTVTLTNANSLSQSISQNYPVNIAFPPLVITSTAPPANGTVGQAYGPFTFTASGGSGNFLWSVSGVAGLTVNSGTGALSGTPTAGGNLTLTVTLTNANNLSQSISQNYLDHCRVYGAGDHERGAARERGARPGLWPVHIHGFRRLGQLPLVSQRRALV